MPTNLIVLLLRSGKSIPRELLVMGVLKVLGKGLDFEELETGSFVSKSSHHSFFHKFLEKFTATQYSKYVHPPRTLEELEECLVSYARLGFPGAIGSIDCTHIAVRFRSLHAVMKEQQLTKTDRALCSGTESLIRC